MDEQRTCPRCGTAVQPGGKVCERCEQPLDAPAAKARYNPAGLAPPSPVQGHATVFAGILIAGALLVFAAWYLLRGVGPFEGRIVGTSDVAGADVIVVEVVVTNEGDRAGKARCGVTATAANGRLRSSEVRLSPEVAPGDTTTMRLRLTGVESARDLELNCGG